MDSYQRRAYTCKIYVPEEKIQTEINSYII